MHGYLPYVYVWINTFNLSHAKQFIKEFEDRKALEAKASKLTWNATKWERSLLIDDKDIVEDGHLVTPDLEKKELSREVIDLSPNDLLVSKPKCNMHQLQGHI